MYVTSTTQFIPVVSVIPLLISSPLSSFMCLHRPLIVTMIILKVIQIIPQSFNRYIGLLCEVLEWQKNHGLSMNKENTANLAIKCESPLSPQSRRLRLKRPYFTEEDGPRSKIFHENDQKHGNEENEDLKRNLQRNPPGTRSDFYFSKEHLRVLRNQYYFPPRWRHNVPFRNLADRNGNNLLMIAPTQNGRDDGKIQNGHGSGKEKGDGKDGNK